MKKFTFWALAIMIVMSFGFSVNNEPEKATILCNGHEITISVNALPAHLKHGDVCLSCPEKEPY